MPRRGRDPNSLLSHEWPEDRDNYRFMVRKVNSAATHLTVDVSWASLMAKNPKVTTTPEEGVQIAKALPMISSDCVILSKDGKPLLAFLRGGIYRPWSEERSARLLEQVTKAIDDLHAVHKPPVPKNHQRHKIDRGSGEHEVYGTHYFALWKAIGHAHEAPTISRDIIKGPASQFSAVLTFLRSITPLTQTISMLFEAVDRDAYNRYRENYNQWLQNPTSPLSAIHTCGRACFMGLALIRNMQAGPHKDSRDTQDGWVGMTCLGDFKGGELVVPALGYKLQHQAGDVVFFRSAVLEHYVADFEGSRTSMVWYTKNDMFEDRGA
ncbi:MAG: hypothetical protein M1816_003118 [Peltula sp. TS41687]|nr:MAG: hypothetical protein M1816_003118 [Peltula sp. TS41687]